MILKFPIKKKNLTPPPHPLPPLRLRRLRLRRGRKASCSASIFGAKAPRKTILIKLLRKVLLRFFFLLRRMAFPVRQVCAPLISNQAHILTEDRGARLGLGIGSPPWPFFWQRGREWNTLAAVCLKFNNFSKRAI